METLKLGIPNSLSTERAEVNSSKHSQQITRACVCQNMPFSPYLCSILPQRSAILPQHIMFHLASGIMYG